MNYEHTCTKRYQYRRMGLVTIKQRTDEGGRLWGALLIVVTVSMVLLPALLNLN